MEEFNKKSDQEIFDIKTKAINVLVLITMFFGPLILFFAYALLVSISVKSLRGIGISFAFLIPLLTIYIKCFEDYTPYLIYGRNVIIDNIADAQVEEQIEEETAEKIEEEPRKIAYDENIDENAKGYVLKNEKYNLTEAEVLDKILKVDENFSKTHFYSYTKNLFTLIQEAWSNKDYQKLRSFEGDRLFNKHKKEIVDLIKTNTKDVRDKIYIKGVLLKDFIIEDNKEILIVAITVSMRRILKSDETRSDYPYIMAFSRNVGVKTNPDLELSTTNCFNCGAVIDVSDDGICNYCNTSLVSGEHEWVLVDLKRLD